MTAHHLECLCLSCVGIDIGNQKGELCESVAVLDYLLLLHQCPIQIGQMLVIPGAPPTYKGLCLFAYTASYTFHPCTRASLASHEEEGSTNA